MYGVPTDFAHFKGERLGFEGHGHGPNVMVGQIFHGAIMAVGGNDVNSST